MNQSTGRTNLCLDMKCVTFSTAPEWEQMCVVNGPVLQLPEKSPDDTMGLYQPRSKVFHAMIFPVVCLSALILTLNLMSFPKDTS